MRQEKFFTANKPAARFKGMQQGRLLSDLAFDPVAVCSTNPWLNNEMQKTKTACLTERKVPVRG
jgi:hypothetical protein